MSSVEPNTKTDRNTSRKPREDMDIGSTPTSKSRVWFITGSSRGFGLCMAECALEAGDSVFATARASASMQHLAQKYGERVRTYSLDVRDAGAAVQAVQAAVDAFGGIDVVVNNAGYAKMSPLEHESEEDLREQLEVNFFGVVNVTRAALPHFRRLKNGHFIQVATVGVRIAAAGLSSYQAAKCAVLGYSKVLNSEVAPLGIRVTILEFGLFRTEWVRCAMDMPPIEDAYQATVGRMADRLSSSLAKAPGDPKRAALAVLEVVSSPNDPPLHLLLGSGAVALAEAYAESQVAEIRKRKELSISADFPHNELQSE